MKRCTVIGWIRQDGSSKSCVAIAAIVCFAMLSVPGEPARAQGAGSYVLVRTKLDVYQNARREQNQVRRTIREIKNGSIIFDEAMINQVDGSLYDRVHTEWKYNPPPAQLAPGQAFQITASGSVKSARFLDSTFKVNGPYFQALDSTMSARATSDQPVTKVFSFKAPVRPTAKGYVMVPFFIESDALNSNIYEYEWQGEVAEAEGHLSARLDCGTLEVVPNQNSESCHIIISGWRRDTANRVEVIFPRQSDGFGSQDKDGKTGIVVPIGQGTEAPSNMSGSRGPDGSYGTEYSWTLFVRARGTALAGTQTIPIIVRQQTGGEVKLELKVRVVPGRSQQTGPRRDGEGTVTGGTDVTPPITQATSPTGLSARLDSGTLVLVPGQMSQTRTVFIKGWRTGTGDQVEVFLPQESKLRGNVGNDLVVSPGSGGVNMFQTANGELLYSLSFRAMERAPGVTTPIEIIVRQKGHQQVRLLLNVVTAPKATGGAGQGGGGTPSGGGSTGSTRTSGTASQVLIDDFEEGMNAWTPRDPERGVTLVKIVPASPIAGPVKSFPGSKSAGSFIFTPATDSWATASINVDGARWAQIGAKQLSFWLNGIAGEAIELRLRARAQAADGSTREEEFVLPMPILLDPRQWRKVVIPLADFKTANGSPLRPGDVYVLQFVQIGTWNLQSFMVDQLQVEGTIPTRGRGTAERAQPPLAGSGAPDLTGRWTFRDGTLDLVQRGNSVTGTFAWSENTGTISGTFNGKTVSGSYTYIWRDPPLITEGQMNATLVGPDQLEADWVFNGRTQRINLRRQP